MPKNELLKAVVDAVPEDQLDALRQVGIRTVPNKTLRFKVTPFCTWKCGFCHKEGGWKEMEQATWDEKSREAFQKLYEAGYREVHLTGGEPTVNNHLPKIIEELTAIGFKVKMTTILAASRNRLRKIAEAGLQGINVSLHDNYSEVDIDSGSVPDEIAEQIASIQIGTSVSKARRQVLSVVSGLEEMQEQEVPIKANTVVSGMADVNRVLGILKYAKSQGITVRLLNALGPGVYEDSMRAISEILKQTESVPTDIKIVKGSSSFGINFVDRDGYKFGIKLITDSYLHTMCDECDIKDTEECTEKYYGVRIESIGGEYFIRLCIDKENEDTLIPVNKFLTSPQFAEIRNNLTRFVVA